MRIRPLLTALAAFALGVLLGAGLWGPLHPVEPKRTIPQTNSLLRLLPGEETGKPADWVEYRKADWHVAVLWVHDPVKKEARIYVFRADSTNAWTLHQSDKVPYEEDCLDYVDVVFPERYLMLINHEGILIKTMLLDEDRELEDDTNANQRSVDTVPSHTNGGR